jgi:hypothetical protein
VVHHQGDLWSDWVRRTFFTRVPGSGDVNVMLRWLRVNARVEIAVLHSPSSRSALNFLGFNLDLSARTAYSLTSFLNLSRISVPWLPQCQKKMKTHYITTMMLLTSQKIFKSNDS